MAITAETRKSIVQLVVTAYNAAPGTALLTQLVTDSVGGKSLADIAATLTTSATFTSIYPTFQTSTEFANEFLGNLVPEASAAAKAEGVAVIEGVLNGGGSRADVILQAQTFLAALAETDASFGSSAANFNNRVEVAEHHTITLELDSKNITDLQNVIASVTSDDATVAPAKAGAAAAGGESGETYTLTTGANAITGTAADDLFIATESTLSSADVLNGGGGNDTLRYASSGTAAVNESGFESSAIETARITADATGGTTFDVTGMTGLTGVTNNNSSQNLTLTGLGASAGVTMTNVSGGNTIVQYKNAALAGSSDAQSVTLNGNASNAGLPTSQLWIGNTSSGGTTGIETLNINSTGAQSILVDVVTGASTINISGDAGLGIINTLDGATKIDASANTIGVSVKADSGANDVVVTGGAGFDSADFSNGWDKGDSFDGGAGTDTLGLTYTVATSIASTNTGTAKNVEVLDVNNAAAANGTIDMDNFAGVTKVVLDDGINTGITATVDDAVTGIEVELDVDSATTGNLVVDLKTDGSADAITVTLDRVGNAGATGGTDVISSINAADAETLTINADDDTTDGKGKVTISSLTATDAKTINLTGDADVTITNTADPATPILATLDASTMTGGASISGTNFVKTGATIKLGSGADTLTFATAAGADTITLGGGKDTVVYNAVAQSDSDTDTITDFVSGTDKLSFQFANPVLNFLGSKPSFGQSQGALSGGAAPASGLDAVYQVDDQILWIDLNDDGTLDNNDFRIKLTGVAAVTAADLGLSSTGNTVTISAAAANVSSTTKTNADKNTTNFGDTIKSTIAFLAGSTINGGLGTDNLTLTDAGAVGAIAATVTNVETLTLGTKASTANTGVAFNDAGVFKSVTGSSNADTIASTAELREGGTISLGDGADTITALALLETAAGADTSVKTTIDMGAGDDSVTTTTLVTWTASTVVKGGAGTDTLVLAAGSNTSAGSLSGFENITTGATATMTNAQVNGATTLTNGGAITVTDAATITTNATNLGAGDTLTLGNFTNTITLGTGTGAGTVTGGTGADSVTGTDTLVAAMAGIDTGTGSDTLTITSFDSNVNVTGITTGLEKVVLQGSGGTGDTFTFDDASMAGAVVVDASALTGQVAIVTGELLVAAVTSYTVSGGAGADTITRTATSTSPGTFNIANGDTVAVDTNLVVDTFNIKANATGTTSVTIAGSDGTAFDDVLNFMNASGTKVSVAGFVINTVAFSGSGVVSAKATDDGTNTVLQIDMNGDGLFGASDIQVTLQGVSDGSAGDGQALFGNVGGALTIL